MYNWGLAWRTEAWFERRERVERAETDRLLVWMKNGLENSRLAGVSFVPLQQALRHVNVAFVNFLRDASRIRVSTGSTLTRVSRCEGVKL